MFSIKRGNTLPVLSVTLQDEKKVPVDLTSAVSVTMHWRLKVPVNSKRHSGTCDIVDAALGRLEFPWGPLDTKFSGEYSCEFYVNYADGSVLTVPNKGYAEFLIEPTL